MRKTRIIAFVVASLVSAASFAGAQAPATQGAGGARGARGEMGRGVEGRPGRDGFFRGLKLSDAEKASVKQVHERYKDENKALRESMRPAMQTIRAARQKGDTAAAKAAFSTTAGTRDKMKALRDREQAEIRAALSPENQKLFDTNLQEQAKRRAEWEKGGHEGHGRGEHKDGRGEHKDGREG